MIGSELMELFEIFGAGLFTLSRCMCSTLRVGEMSSVEVICDLVLTATGRLLNNVLISPKPAYKDSTILWKLLNWFCRAKTLEERVARDDFLHSEQKKTTPESRLQSLSIVGPLISTHFP